MGVIIVTDKQQLTRLGAHTHWIILTGTNKIKSFLEAQIEGAEIIDHTNTTLKFKKHTKLSVHDGKIEYADEDLL